MKRILEQYCILSRLRINYNKLELKIRKNCHPKFKRTFKGILQVRKSFFFFLGGAGLGIRNMHAMTKTLLAKIARRIVNGQSWLFQETLVKKY